MEHNDLGNKEVWTRFKSAVAEGQHIAVAVYDHNRLKIVQRSLLSDVSVKRKVDKDKYVEAENGARIYFIVATDEAGRGRRLNAVFIDSHPIPNDATAEARFRRMEAGVSQISREIFYITP